MKEMTIEEKRNKRREEWINESPIKFKNMESLSPECLDYVKRMKRAFDKDVVYCIYNYAGYIGSVRPSYLMDRDYLFDVAIHSKIAPYCMQGDEEFFKEILFKSADALLRKKKKEHTFCEQERQSIERQMEIVGQTSIFDFI